MTSQPYSIDEPLNDGILVTEATSADNVPCAQLEYLSAEATKDLQSIDIYVDSDGMILNPELITTIDSTSENDNHLNLGIQFVTESVFDIDPDNIHVKTVKSENEGASQSVTCDIYARCSEHTNEEIGSGVWFDLGDGRHNSEEGLKQFECQETFSSSLGEFRLSCKLVDDFKTLIALPQSLLTVESEPQVVESNAKTDTGESVEKTCVDTIPTVVLNDEVVTEAMVVEKEEKEAMVTVKEETPAVEGNVVMKETVEPSETMIIKEAAAMDCGLIESNLSVLDQVHVAVRSRENDSTPQMSINNQSDINQSAQDIRYGCGRCPFISESLSDVKSHTRTAHAVGFMTSSPLCDVCGKVFSSSANLARHRLIHDKIRLFTCSHCSKGFTQKVHCDRHVSEQRNADPHHQQCTLCTFQTHYRCALSKHYRDLHPSMPYVKINPQKQTTTVWQCGVCSFECPSRKDLAQHMKIHTSRAPLKYECEYCSFVTDYACRIKRHKLSHTQQRPYQCGICEYRGSQIEHVIRHMRSVHKSEPEYTYTENKNNVDVTTVLPRGANIDELHKTKVLYGLRQSFRLKSKENRDEITKTFSCYFCEVGFQRARNLLKHVDDLHANEMNRYSCSHCQSVSATSGEFITHLNSHKLPVPLVDRRCAMCEFTTTSRRKYVYHLRAKHNILFKKTQLHLPNLPVIDTRQWGIDDDSFPEPDVMDVSLFNPNSELEANDVEEKTEDAEILQTGADSDKVVYIQGGDLIKIGDKVYIIQTESSLASS